MIDGSKPFPYNGMTPYRLQCEPWPATSAEYDMDFSSSSRNEEHGFHPFHVRPNV